MKKEGGFAYLTAEEMTSIDREAVERFGIPVEILMEHAGIATARLARRMLGSVGGKKVCCLVGKGNNGGDGLVAARHLKNWGAKVRVVLGCARSEIRDLPARQLGIAGRLGIQVEEGSRSLGGSDLLLDALLGYGARGDPRGEVAGLIMAANSSGSKVLSVDLPSGLDATTGEPNVPCMIAEATVTFGFPKTGFLNPRAIRHLGEVYVADISLPAEVYERHSIGLPAFGDDGLLRMR